MRKIIKFLTKSENLLWILVIYWALFNPGKGIFLSSLCVLIGVFIYELITDKK